MSKGAGRVEQAIRDAIARDRRRQQFRPEGLVRDVFGWGPITTAQRKSVLRAMHRIIDGQPGWRVHSLKGERGVVFEFTPPAETPKSRQKAAAHLMQRSLKVKPKSPRQRAREAGAGTGHRPPPDAAVFLDSWTRHGGRRGCRSAGTTAWLHRGDDRRVPDRPSGIGCEAFDRVVTPPQTEDEAMLALGLDRIMRWAVSHEEVRWYQARAGAIRFMFASVRAVRQKAEIVDLTGEWWLARNLRAVEDLRFSGSYSPPSRD
jgi:hypothetical protein